MSKLLLTSAGFMNTKIAQSFVTVLGKDLGEASVALVPTAARSIDERFHVEKSHKELADLGIGSIVEIDAAEPQEPGALDRFDALYMCGGNTYFILQTIRQTGFDRLIIDFLKRGGLYVGVSAGSLLMGPDIEVAGLGPNGDPNDVELLDTGGLKQVPFAVYPHYTEQDQKFLDAFREISTYPILELTDEQAMLCVDAHYLRIG